MPKAPAFNLIPRERLQVDLPGFKASAWTPITVRGVPHLMSECYELVGK